MLEWQIVHGDCVDGMRGLPNKSIDVVITDPPYSEKTHKAQRRGCTGYVEPTRPGAIRAQFNRVRDLKFAHLEPELRRAAAVEFARLAKRWVLVFSDHEGSEAWRQDLVAAGLEHVRFGIWVKKGAAPQFTGDRPAQGHEVIVIAHPKGRKRWNGGGTHGVWTHPIVLNRGGKTPRLHTAQKPLALMEDLVRLFSNEGEVVLDPFAGSGTTGLACLNLGRNFLGWESDENYVETAKKRLEGAIRNRAQG